MQQLYCLCLSIGNKLAKHLAIALGQMPFLMEPGLENCNRRTTLTTKLPQPYNAMIISDNIHLIVKKNIYPTSARKLCVLCRNWSIIFYKCAANNYCFHSKNKTNFNTRFSWNKNVFFFLFVSSWTLIKSKKRNKKMWKQSKNIEK